MSLRFAIKDWAAFAPGLSSREDWLSWAVRPWLPQGEASPALAEMPPMQRRRVESLGRMALQVAYWCQSAQDERLPMVFASRHGDLSRTYEMLQVLARDEPLSPTSFGLSTHNAISAQYSIARHLTGNHLVVSAGAATAEAALIEAVALLADGAEELLVVVYDGPLPEDYRVYADEPGSSYAWAWRVVPAGAAGPGLTLDIDEPGPASPDPGSLPHGLEVLRFAIGGVPELRFSALGRHWRWQRHA